MIGNADKPPTSGEAMEKPSAMVSEGIEKGLKTRKIQTAFGSREAHPTERKG
jgi:hypothetical protein